MSSVLYALGRRAYRHRWVVVAAWLLLLALVGGATGLLSKGTDNTFRIPGTESQEALDNLSRTFPQVSGATAQVVVVAPDGTRVDDPAVRGPVQEAVTALGDVDRVAAVTDPYGEQVSGTVSDDGTAAIVAVQLEDQASTIPATLREDVDDVVTDLRAELPAGSQVSVGGLADTVPEVSATEAIGLAVALVVLVLTFGSLLAAGMPIVVALLGVAITTAGIFLATAFATVSSTTPLLSLMLGLAVGIDYTLFIVSRHVDQVRAGMDPEESAARSTATAGSAVVFAGLTVVIALLGLGVTRIPFLTVMGVAAAVGVTTAVLVSLTLTPALLGFAGDRLARPSLFGRRGRRRVATLEDGPQGNRVLRGWVTGVTRRPVLTVVGVLGVVLALSVPALDLRLALPDAGTRPAGDPDRVTYDLVSEEFGPGFNGPLIVTGSIISSTDPLGLMADLKREIEALPGVAAVPVATPNATADTGILQVVPEGGPDSQATKDLVTELRDSADRIEREYGFDLAVTGVTAVQIDISDLLARALLPFALLVVGLSLVLLTMVFRSVWVPVKATVGFLLSVGASFGAVAAVFEWGWGADLLNVDKTGPVISFLPIILMGVLFGLAMDYEVFLVSRMREEHVHGGDARAAVRRGFLGSGKVVTAAALIMIAVFAAFVPHGDANIKPIALGLAVGVFVDAFVVRMTLVPAVMQLLGERAWWMPRWLDRLLPSFDVEGEALAKELSMASWPPQDPGAAVAAQGLRLDVPHGTVYSGVDVVVPAGGVLVVDGPHRSGRSALLLTLAGRVAPSSGLLKVAGYAVPERAGAVRRRVGLVRLAGEPDPVGVVEEALAERPAVLVVDDVDHVSDPVAADALAQRLAAASVDGVTLVVGCADAGDVRALLDGAPPGRAAELTLPHAESHPLELEPTHEVHR